MKIYWRPAWVAFVGRSWQSGIRQFPEFLDRGAHRKQMAGRTANILVQDHGLGEGSLIATNLGRTALGYLISLALIL